MIVRTCVFLLLSATLLAQEGPFGPPVPKGEVPPRNVSFERIRDANKEPQNWLTYSGGLSSQRHSLLTTIRPANARDLELKWVFQSRSLERHQVTPLVVDGTMYTIQSPNDVIALNAATGKQIWVYSHTPDPAAKNCCGRLSRGLAILGDTIFLASFDARIIAIDARNGRELWKTEPAGDPKQGYAFTHAPLVVKDKVIAGTAGGEFGVRGFIAAWDVKTGKEAWRFNTVPGPGEPGNETWAGDSWMHGGAPIWVTGSYDPELNLTYWGTGNPGPDWDGAGRLGDNLYSASVIALDPDTGTLKWHYQFSPHNEFDWDSAQVPVLADMDWQGRPRKVMLWANRNGMSYVLDRASGQFLKAQPFVKVNWADGFDEKGRPIPVPGIAPTKEGTLVYPGNQGAHELVQPVVQPAHRPVLRADVGEHVDHVREGRYASGLPRGAGVHRHLSPSRLQHRRCPRIDQCDRSQDRNEEVDAQTLGAQPGGGGVDDGVRHAVRRRARRLVLRARCPHRQAAVADESRAIGRGRPDHLCRERQAVRQHHGRELDVYVWSARGAELGGRW